ncbi:sigma-70 family RNA polymerase sigma factor [Singulisphaera sp. Ch08]|uniref:Sigma-70 family RNA polymerase sigma factor n=1 Tax=Singulisphaera sp. Ch08 TaxID=3120278 RepID=A0AAU7CTK5_9BACT
MIDTSLDTLLVKLTRGDDSAAERVFRDYEPFLRAMIRKRLTPALRTKFDTMDIVQSVWTDVLESYRAEGWKFTDRDHLRAFLGRVTYNHFCRQCRRHGPSLKREQPLSGNESPAIFTSNEPRPSQLAQAGELWKTISDLCPSNHLEVVRLKREGVPLAEIAERTGLHEGSVRRILYELARRLAAERTRTGQVAKLSR